MVCIINYIVSQIKLTRLNGIIRSLFIPRKIIQVNKDPHEFKYDIYKFCRNMNVVETENFCERSVI